MCGVDPLCLKKYTRAYEINIISTKKEEKKS